MYIHCYLVTNIRKSYHFLFSNVFKSHATINFKAHNGGLNILTESLETNLLLFRKQLRFVKLPKDFLNSCSFLILFKSFDAKKYRYKKEMMAKDSFNVKAATANFYKTQKLEKLFSLF